MGGSGTPSSSSGSGSGSSPSSGANSSGGIAPTGSSTGAGGSGTGSVSGASSGTSSPGGGAETSGGSDASAPAVDASSGDDAGTGSEASAGSEADARSEVDAGLTGATCPPGGQFTCTFATPTGIGTEHLTYWFYAEVIDTTPGENNCRAGAIQTELDTTSHLSFVWPNILKPGHTYQIAQWEDYAKDHTCHSNPSGNGNSAQWLFPVPGVCNPNCSYSGTVTTDFTYNFSSTPAPTRAGCCQDYPTGPITGITPTPSP
jgi:hypothetical protein